MKKFLIFAIVSCSIFTTTFAVRYDFGGVNTTNCSPFVNFYNDFTYDWRASHGSPSLASGSRAILGYSPDNNSFDGYSEGVYLNYSFLSTHTYSISVKIGSASVNSPEVKIGVVNGMSPGGQFAGCNYEKEPFYNDYYPLIYSGFITGEIIKSKNNWAPNRDYSQIWVSSNGNQVSTASIYYIDIIDHGVPDSQPPTTPLNLSSSNITNNSFKLAWSASNDNTGVVGYKLYNRNNVLVANTPNTNYTFSGRTACTSNIVKVKAYDAAGNLSTATSITVNTTSNIPSNLTFASLITNSVVTKEASKSITLNPGFEYAAYQSNDYLLAHITNGSCGSYGAGLRMAAQEAEGTITTNASEDYNSFVDELNGSISIYPNPAISEVKVNSEYSNISKIEIFDVYGELIKQNYNSNSIDVSDLKTAIYFFKVTAMDGASVIEKIMKQ